MAYGTGPRVRVPSACDDGTVTAEAAGCRLLFLPPYSPGLSPIEVAFSEFKRLLRTAAERAVEGLWAAIGRALGEFPRGECRNYIRHAGHTATET